MWDTLAGVHLTQTQEVREDFLEVSAEPRPEG